MTDRMKDVSHTNPYTGEPFGEACAFERGPVVAADGGRDTEESTETMRDVSHTPLYGGTESVGRAFERGTEGRDETV